MKITIIGAGNLGQSIAKGILNSGTNVALCLTRRHLEAIREFSKYNNVTLTTENSTAVQQSDILIFAVQPRVFDKVIEEIKPFLTPHHLIISVIAGCSISKIESSLGTPQQPIIRAMPNTASSVRQSMTCMASNASGKKHLDTAKVIFDSIGQSMIIPEEHLQAATVICASGIAFWMRLIRATTQGAIQLGFEAEQAYELAMQTCFGAVSLLKHSGRHPESEIDRVTTPSGCTIKGLNEMEHQGLSASLIRGINASFEKINEIRIK